MVAKSPVYPSSPRATLLTQKQGVPDGKGDRALARAAMSDKHGGLIDVHVHVPWLPGLECSGNNASPFDGPLLSILVFAPSLPPAYFTR